MNARYLLIISFICITYFHSYAQSFIISNAVNLYDSGNMEAAKNQIERAAMHPRYKLFPKTWYYYYLINKELSNQECLIKATNSMMELSKDAPYYIKFKHYVEGETEIFTNHPEDVAYNINDYFYLLSIFEFLEDEDSKDKFNLMVADYYYSERLYDSSLVYYGKKATSREIQFKNYLGQLNVFSTRRNLSLYEETMGKAKADFPNESKFIYFEIDRLISRKLYFKAKSKIETSLIEDPNSAKLCVRLGEVYDLLNRTIESAEAYMKAYNLDPESFAANLRLGVIYKEQVTRSSSDSVANIAKKHLEKAEQLSPKNIDVLKPLEELYLDLRDIPNYTRVSEIINSL